MNQGEVDIISEDIRGLREDVRSLTKAVMTVATVLMARYNYKCGGAGLAQAREDAERTHALVACK